MKIGKKIAEARKNKNLTQEQLAESKLVPVSAITSLKFEKEGK
ncbi:hypothetical protein [Emergencia sp.]